MLAIGDAFQSKASLEGVGSKPGAHQRLGRRLPCVVSINSIVAVLQQCRPPIRNR